MPFWFNRIRRMNGPRARGVQSNAAWRAGTRSYQALAAAAAYAAKGVAKFRKKRGLRGFSKNKLSINQRAQQVGQGGSISKFFYGKQRLALPKSVLKTMSKNFYVENNAGRTTSTVGNQEVTRVAQLFAPSTLNPIIATISGSATQKAVLLSCTAETMITNQGLGTVRVTLYDIISRRDVNNATIGYPDNAVKTGLADEGASAGSYSVVGTTPFSTDRFTQFYKVVKVTHIYLAQGQTHSHRIHYAPNRVVNREYTNLGGTSTYALRNLSCFTLMYQHGQVANDVTTKTQVSIGATALDWVTRYQYKYSYIDDSVTNYQYVNNLPANFTVGEDIIDIGSGAITTENFA